MARPDSLEAMLLQAASDAPLDEALAGLADVARALGIYEATWAAQSIPEVAAMLVAEIEHRKQAAQVSQLAAAVAEVGQALWDGMDPAARAALRQVLAAAYTAAGGA